MASGLGIFKMQKHAALSAIMLMFFFSACASATKKEVPGPVQVVPSQPLVLAPPAEMQGPMPYVYPEKVENPDQVVVVLGSGMVQGYSCVGILKSLREMKVPIRAIYAREVCALVSALYLTQPTLNRMDWALMQFSEDALIKEKSGLRMTSTESKLESKLQEIFGEKQLEELNPPLIIPLVDEAGVTHMFKKGKLKEVIRASLSTPKGLSPGKIEGRPYRGWHPDGPYTYLGGGIEANGYPVFLFEIEKMNPARVSHTELSALNVEVISVPVRHISDQDFKKRNEAIYLGKKATQEAKAKIFERLGRTE